MILRMLRLALVSDGYEVVVAQDGVEGLIEIEASRFDLVVLDLQMPRMDGRAMYREARSRGFLSPVLVLSAYGAEEARHQLRANAALGKPFDTDVLLRKVRDLLSA